VHFVFAKLPVDFVALFSVVIKITEPSPCQIHNAIGTTRFRSSLVRSMLLPSFLCKENMSPFDQKFNLKVLIVVTGFDASWLGRTSLALYPYLGFLPRQWNERILE